MRQRPSVFTLFVLGTLSLAGVLVSTCSPTPSEPSRVIAGTPATGDTSSLAPTPTGTPSRCTCTSVSVQFDPGGNTPQWGVYVVNGNGNATSRVGFRIDVTCTGTGESNRCTVYQIEKGALTWTTGGRTGKIVGKESKVTNFPKGKFGDPWQKEYSDALGADYPGNTTEKMTVTLDMEFEIKCVSADGRSISNKFKITGSVDAQAAKRGGKPTLSGGTITLTPQ